MEQFEPQKSYLSESIYLQAGLRADPPPFIPSPFVPPLSAVNQVTPCSSHTLSAVGQNGGLYNDVEVPDLS